MDRGLVFLSLPAVFCNNILCVGYFLAFGVFFVEIIDVFHASSSLTSLVMGVQQAVNCLTGTSLSLSLSLSRARARARARVYVFVFVCLCMCMCT